MPRKKKQKGSTFAATAKRKKLYKAKMSMKNSESITDPENELEKHANQSDERKWENLCRVVAKGQSISLLCTDFLIGSGSLSKFLNGSYNIKTAHSRFRERTFNVGALGELLFCKSHSDSILLVEPCARIKNIKVISAVPDFIIKKDEKYSIVEIKSANKNNRPKSAHKADVIQTWGALDAFGLNEAEIYYYEINEETNEAVLTICPLVKEEALFDQELFNCFLAKYKDFFYEFSLINGIKMDQKDGFELEKALRKQFLMGPAVSKNISCLHNKKEIIEHKGTCILLYYHIFRDFTAEGYIEKIAYSKTNTSSARMMYTKKKQKAIKKAKDLGSIQITEITHRDTIRLNGKYKKTKKLYTKTKKIKKVPKPPPPKQSNINEKHFKSNISRGDMKSDEEYIHGYNQFRDVMEKNKALQNNIETLIEDKQRLNQIIVDLRAAVYDNTKNINDLTGKMSDVEKSLEELRNSIGVSNFHNNMDESNRKAHSRGRVYQKKRNKKGKAWDGLNNKGSRE